MNRFKLRRIRKNLTQYQLAKATGIHQSTISLFENGMIDLPEESLQKIRQELGLSERRKRDTVEKPTLSSESQ